MNHIETISIDDSLGKGERTRLLLLESAAALFEDQGYLGANMRDIAARAGIKAGSMFYHFKDKEELLFVLLKRTITTIIAVQAENLRSAHSARDRLRGLVKTEVEAILIRSPGVSFQSLFHEWRHLSKPYTDQLMKLRQGYERTWLEVLGQCRDEKLLLASPKITRRLLNGSFAWIRYWYDIEGEMTMDQIIDEAVLLLIGQSFQGESGKTPENPN